MGTWLGRPRVLHRWAAVLASYATLACGSGERTSDATFGTPHEDVAVDTAVTACPSFSFSLVVPRAIASDERAFVIVRADRGASDDGVLDYNWTATSGAFTQPTRAFTEYACHTPGPQVLTVTATDSEGCASDLALDVTCAEPPSAP